MVDSRIGVFGPGFIPGKNQEEDGVSRAMERRWSGLPGHPANVEDTHRYRSSVPSAQDGSTKE